MSGGARVAGLLDGEAVARLMLAAGLIDEQQLREALTRRQKRIAARARTTLNEGSGR